MHGRALVWMSLRLPIVEYANGRAKLLRRARIRAVKSTRLVTLCLANGSHIYDRILRYTEPYTHRVSLNHAVPAQSTMTVSHQILTVSRQRPVSFTAKGTAYRHLLLHG